MLLFTLLAIAHAELPEFIADCAWTDEIKVDPDNWSMEGIEGSLTRMKFKTTWVSRDEKQQVQSDFILDTKQCAGLGFVLEGAPGAGEMTGSRKTLGAGLDASNWAIVEKQAGFSAYAEDNAAHLLGRPTPAPSGTSAGQAPGVPVQIWSASAPIDMSLTGKPRPKGKVWRELGPDLWQVVDASAYDLVVRLTTGTVEIWIYDAKATRAGGVLVVVDPKTGHHGIAWRGDADFVPLASAWNARALQANRTLETSTIQTIEGRAWFRFHARGTKQGELVGIAADGRSVTLVAFGKPKDADAVQVIDLDATGVKISPVHYGPIQQEPTWPVPWSALGAR